MHYEIKAHDVRCNGCGVDLSDETEMFYFSEDCAKEALELEQWHTAADGNHYCRDCCKIDSEGKVVISPSEGATFSLPKEAESSWRTINGPEDMPEKLGWYETWRASSIYPHIETCTGDREEDFKMWRKYGITHWREHRPGPLFWEGGVK